MTSPPTNSRSCKHNQDAECHCITCFCGKCRGEGVSSLDRKVQASVEATNQYYKENKMNVGHYVTNAFEQHEFVSGKDVGKSCVAKILEVKPVKTPKFDGLFLTLKIGAEKRTLGVSFERFDIGSICKQIKSDETDDWIGENITLITKKVGRIVYVNVAPSKRTATKKRRKK